MASVSIDLPFPINSNTCENATSVFIRLNDNATNDFLFNDTILDFLKGLGRMFYIVNPEDTTFARPENVPHFYRQVSLILFYFILLRLSCFSVLLYY